jgi:hypothetical protein
MSPVAPEAALTGLRRAPSADAAPEIMVLLEDGYPGHYFAPDDRAAAALPRHSLARRPDHDT